MDYALEIMPSCRGDIEKACRKNPVLKKAITNKIDEILKNPERYKPLRGVLAGERRVHILKSFVLIYEIVYARKAVCFIRFAHHDKAY